MHMHDTAAENFLLSIVIPVFNEEETIPIWNPAIRLLPVKPLKYKLFCRINP